MNSKKSKNKQQAKSDAVSWTPNAWDEYLSWRAEDQKIVYEINNLIDECRRNPFKGTGKPEPLTGNLTDATIYAVSCRYHH